MIESTDIAIVGGGVTGLSAAWYVQQFAQASGRELRCLLLESTNRWGGKIATERVDSAGGEPFVLEAGPDSFLTSKPWALNLLCELGLESDALPVNDAQQPTYILSRGRLLPMPAGMALVVPTRMGPFLRSPLLTWPGKLRVLAELVLPPARGGADETLAAFARRRLGHEALDRLAEPLLSGIYSAGADEQSVLATFPNLRRLESEHGSLIRGMRAAVSRNGEEPAPPAFLTLRPGMEALVQGLLGRLACDRRLVAPVLDIRRVADAFELLLPDGVVRAAAVILALPAFAAAGLLHDLAPDAAAGLRGIRYLDTGTISLAYHRRDIEHDLRGTGILIPRGEKRAINAVTWTSSKIKHRTPEEAVLLRLFFGGARTPQTYALDDGAVEAAARSELSSIMGINAQPILSRIYRWPAGAPQYDLGHLQRVAAVEAALPAGITIAGSPYRGIGIPDCVRQGKESAGRALSYLSVQSSMISVQCSVGTIFEAPLQGTPTQRPYTVSSAHSSVTTEHWPLNTDQSQQEVVQE